MITRENLKEHLTALGYEVNSKQSLWTKSFAHSQARITVDFAAKRILYPEGLVVNRKVTTNFSANENFVVLDCITRLLSQGYQPHHLILEADVPGGHKASGGYLDIIVKNNQGEDFLIIECKTPDEGRKKEFSSAWSKTKKDGGQLFNYFNTYRAAKALCLYTAEHYEGQALYTSYIITLEDNEDYLRTYTREREVEGYDDVRSRQGGKDEYYRVWKTTYDYDYSTTGIFEANIEPFGIQKHKPNLSVLREANEVEIQKKYHEYATIMRQHNVSGRENAFDKLVNLFLAKIVDETLNPDALEFYWRGASSDNYYSLQDRLQRMYSLGMRQFLGEDVTYIDDEAIEQSFHRFKNDPDTTRDKVLDYFRRLKFYTNNDFAFLDVHNETLFRQNGEILKEVVRMLQDLRLKGERQNQFLGDLFEGFLDQGIKQSEGQFFTPMPIVRFLVSALPLADLHERADAIPKVIDYACGAGHFLSEYAGQIKPLVEAKGENPREYYAQIYGVEKEYRLSKVAKVSAFMYGQEEIKIIYQDALRRHADLGEGTFSVLVANPPYSVKGFLETLSERERAAYHLSQEVADISKNNSIELFFIERAAQLLAPEGVAAIILPSSVLSNDNNRLYSKAREILLQHFVLVGIAEFGSGTFGKTGTNTVTLFLRKRKDKDLHLHYRNRVEAWFNGNFKHDGLFEDEHLLGAYCRYIGVDAELYRALLLSRPTPELWAVEYFGAYRKHFGQDATAKQILKKRLSAKYSEADRLAKWEAYILSAVQAVEAEKLYFFILARQQKHPVFLVKSPADKEGIKRFLGYGWSESKGDEGIKYIGISQGNENGELLLRKGIEGIQTPLFNPNNLDDEHYINSLLRSYFGAKPLPIPEHLSAYCSTLRLEDMIDFSRTDFDLALRTSVKTKVEVQSKYPVVPLGEVVDVKIGGTPSRKIASYFNGNNLWVSVAEMDGKAIFDTKEKITNEGVKNSNVKLLSRGTTLLSFKLSIGKTAIAGADLYTNEAIAGLVPKTAAKILDLYLFHYFHGLGLNHTSVGNKAFGKSLNSTYLKNEVKIPLPPLSVQEEIVAECAKVDEEYQNSRMAIEEYRQRIAQVFSDLEVVNNSKMGGGNFLTIGELCSVSSGGTPDRKNAKYWSEGTIPWLKSEVCKGGEVSSASEYITELGYKHSSAKLFSRGTTLMALVGATKGKTAYLSIDAATNQNIAGLKPLSNERLLDKYLFYICRHQYNEIIIGLSAYDILNLKHIQNISIPVPPIAEQERIVAEVEAYEAKIREAEQVIAGCADRKVAILRHYLD